MKHSFNILQIGCGNMGYAVARNIVKSSNKLTILERKEGSDFAKTLNCNLFSSFEEVAKINFDVVVIAVKPQDFYKIADQINSVCSNNTVVISIMAAISVRSISEKIISTKQFVRAMPNLGILSDFGVTIIYNKTKKNKVSDLLNDIFDNDKNVVINVKNEKELNKLTPFTGSGAAVFLYIANVFQDIMQVFTKLDKNTTFKAMQGVLNQALEMSKNNVFDECVNKIASKGGVTIAMIEKMSGVSKLIKASINSGLKRIVELESKLK